MVGTKVNDPRILDSFFVDAIVGPRSPTRFNECRETFRQARKPFSVTYCHVEEWHRPYISHVNPSTLPVMCIKTEERFGCPPDIRLVLCFFTELSVRFLVLI